MIDCCHILLQHTWIVQGLANGIYVSSRAWFQLAPSTKTLVGSVAVESKHGSTVSRQVTNQRRSPRLKTAIWTLWRSPFTHVSTSRRRAATAVSSTLPRDVVLKRHVEGNEVFHLTEQTDGRGRGVRVWWGGHGEVVLCGPTPHGFAGMCGISWSYLDPEMVLPSLRFLSRHPWRIILLSSSSEKAQLLHHEITKLGMSSG